MRLFHHHHHHHHLLLILILTAMAHFHRNAACTENPPPHPNASVLEAAARADYEVVQAFSLKFQPHRIAAAFERVGNTTSGDDTGTWSLPFWRHIHALAAMQAFTEAIELVRSELLRLHLSGSDDSDDDDSDDDEVFQAYFAVFWVGIQGQSMIEMAEDNSRRGQRRGRRHPQKIRGDKPEGASLDTHIIWATQRLGPFMNGAGRGTWRRGFFECLGLLGGHEAEQHKACQNAATVGPSSRKTQKTRKGTTKTWTKNNNNKKGFDIGTGASLQFVRGLAKHQLGRFALQQTVRPPSQQQQQQQQQQQRQQQSPQGMQLGGACDWLEKALTEHGNLAARWDTFACRQAASAHEERRSLQQSKPSVKEPRRWRFRTVPRRSIESLSLDIFYAEFVRTNTPLIIAPSALTQRQQNDGDGESNDIAPRLGLEWLLSVCGSAAADDVGVEHKSGVADSLTLPHNAQDHVSSSPEIKKSVAVVAPLAARTIAAILGGTREKRGAGEEEQDVKKKTQKKEHVKKTKGGVVTWARWQLRAACPSLVPLLPPFDERAIQAAARYNLNSNSSVAAAVMRPLLGDQSILSASVTDAWQLWVNSDGVASRLHTDALESHHLIHLLPPSSSSNHGTEHALRRKYCIFPAGSIGLLGYNPWSRSFDNNPSPSELSADCLRQAAPGTDALRTEAVDEEGGGGDGAGKSGEGEPAPWRLDLFPGETLFIPAGCPHAVISSSLSSTSPFTVAVSRNFVDSSSSWRALRAASRDALHPFYFHAAGSFSFSGSGGGGGGGLNGLRDPSDADREADAALALLVPQMLQAEGADQGGGNGDAAQCDLNVTAASVGAPSATFAAWPNALTYRSQLPPLLSPSPLPPSSSPSLPPWVFDDLAEDCAIVDLVARDLALASAASRTSVGRTYAAPAASVGGGTFFIAADAVPRSTLERLALSIFHAHVQRSGRDNRWIKGKPVKVAGAAGRIGGGAEWWVQFGEDGASGGGLHFDRDSLRWQLSAMSSDGAREGRADDDSLFYPWLSTVTYLNNGGAGGGTEISSSRTHSRSSSGGSSSGSKKSGAPTLVLESRLTPSQANGGGGGAVASVMTAAKRAWVSWPEPGKHVAFDGTLLHGPAPELSRRGGDSNGDGRGGDVGGDGSGDDKGNGSGDVGLGKNGHQRLVLVVNLWPGQGGAPPWGVHSFPSSEVHRLSDLAGLDLDISAAPAPLPPLASTGDPSTAGVVEDTSAETTETALEVVMRAGPHGGGVRIDVPRKFLRSPGAQHHQGTTAALIFPPGAEPLPFLWAGGCGDD